MAFTNNRIDFFENESYTEKLHAFALDKGLVNVVKEGLDLTGTTLTNGYYANGGVLGQLGNDGETMEITPNLTCFLVIKSTLNGVNSKSEIIESDTYLSTPLSDTGNVKYFTIYELENGVVINDYRYRNFINSVEVVDLGDDQFAIKINDEISNSFDTSVIQNAWSKSEADLRYERAISLNTNYVNEDFLDMNMAQVVNLVLSEVTEYGAGVIVGVGSDTELSNLRTALVDLIAEFYNVTILATATLSFRLEVNGSVLSGGNTLRIEINNGVSYELGYGSYGTNHATVNSDAFKLPTTKTGPSSFYGQVSIYKNKIDLYDVPNGYDYTAHGVPNGVSDPSILNGMRWVYENSNTAGRIQFGVDESEERILFVSGNYSASGEVAIGIRSKGHTKLYDYGASEFKAGVASLLGAELLTLKQVLITEENMQDLREEMATALSLPITRETSRIAELIALIEIKEAELQEALYQDEITAAEGNLMAAKEYIEAKISKGEYKLKDGNDLIAKRKEEIEEIKQRYGKE